jgi:hypothetical protein
VFQLRGPVYGQRSAPRAWYHSCPLLKITSEITSLLEVLRGASNFGVILRNYLEAPKAGNQLLINLFLFKKTQK